ncbi:MAG: hypothetical protein ACKPCK_08305, partial [Dolichospermum sp.]
LLHQESFLFGVLSGKACIGLQAAAEWLRRACARYMVLEEAGNNDEFALEGDGPDAPHLVLGQQVDASPCADANPELRAWGFQKSHQIEQN